MQKTYSKSSSTSKNVIRFSVIIPLYNKANFVLKSIESVLNQTFGDFEIVVVNDGSTDDSLSVVNGIKDARIRIFSKENGGVSSARNFGIGEAQNEYIAFLDADDLWLPDYLEAIKGMIEMYPQAGIFATGRTSIFPDKKIDRIVFNLPKGKIVLIDNYCKALIKKEIIQLWTGTVCVKKKLFNKTGGFREGIKTGEDMDMWLRLSFVSPIVWNNEVKAIYNLVSENNATSHLYSYKYEFPYWEWYAYDSSIYLKIYANKNIKNMLKISSVSRRDKIRILLKFNCFYVLLHFFYYVYDSIRNIINKK